ncbi:MAG: hypothetical protein M0026_04300 [Nocardiopsaceae bacterium]|nr:hypothetical protein [Nocardiopsaceae bacterium]
MADEKSRTEVSYPKGADIQPGVSRDFPKGLKIKPGTVDKGPNATARAAKVRAAQKLQKGKGKGSAR